VTIRRLLLVVAATLGAGAAVASAATLGVGSWHLWTGSQTLTKGTCTLTGVVTTTDTYVAEGSPTSSFGTSTTMQVAPNTGAQKWSFVTFDLSSCSIPTSGGADTATLKLVVTVTPRKSRTLTIAPVLSSWSGALTWNGAQSLAYGSTTTTFSTGTTNGATLSIPVTVDVDALIKNPTASFGWRISDGGATATQDTTTFATAQASSGLPQLVIDYAK